VIKSWANVATRKWADEGKSRFKGMDADAAQELLAMLNAASALSDLSPLKSVGLHKLKGGRKEQWAITVNGPWCICFGFIDGDAWDVEIIDYH
jgi:proteic killer suppression protein